jgi:signal transduction histidine kinase
VGQLWSLYSQGLQEFVANDWVQYPIPELRILQHPTSPYQLNYIPLVPAEHGRVLFLLPDRLMEFSTTERRTVILKTANEGNIGLFRDMISARDGGVWICGDRGLAHAPGPTRNVRKDSRWTEYPLPGAFGPITSLHNLLEDERGGVAVVASGPEEERQALFFSDGKFKRVQFSGEKIVQAWRGAEDRYWARTTSALFYYSEGANQVVREDLPAGQLFDVAVQDSHSFWVATSEGLFRYAPPCWRPPPKVRLAGQVHALFDGGAEVMGAVSGSGVLLMNNTGTHQMYEFPLALAPIFEPTDLAYSLPSGDIVVGHQHGVLQLNPETGIFRPLKAPEREGELRLVGTLHDGTVCLQQLEASGPNPYSLLQYDGKELTPLPPHKLGHKLGTSLQAFLTARNGDWWVGGDQGVALFRQGKWITFGVTDGNPPESGSSFLEIGDGKVWCAARDQIWEYDGKKWSLLRRGLDRINGLARGRDGSIWVASNSGLYRFFKGIWAAIGVEEGLPSAAVFEVYEDRRGRIWVGTGRGLSIYHPEADLEAPRSIIQRVSIEKQVENAGNSISVYLTGKDKWKFTSADRLLYSYRLDEQEWSPFTSETILSFRDLPSGQHYLRIRAMDRNWNLGDPVQYGFTIKLPWYKETRLVVIALLGLGVALFFAALAFNRHLVLVRSYAEIEKTVQLRTAELEKAHQQLLHSQKMNAMGTLAAGIAHDFNNILSIIKGSAQIIESNLENPDTVKVRVNRIKTVVEQGSSIVKAMLGFSRKADETLAPCDINAAVEETVKLLGDRFQDETELLLNHASDLPPVVCSRNQLQQILLNLIFNAHDAVQDAGRIVLKVERTAQVPYDSVLKPHDASDYVAIAVQDNGSGIPAEVLPRIFEPFFTTKAFSARRGTGLGLSMVYELCRQLGYGIHVKTALNNGSTFTIFLPLVAAASPKLDHHVKVP